MSSAWTEEGNMHATGHDRMETEEVLTPASRNYNEHLLDAERNLFSLLKEHICVSDSWQGYFSVLTNDLIRIVFSFFEEDRTYARATRVNKRWKEIADAMWHSYTVERGLLDDDPTFWIQRGKNWKWILQSKKNHFCADTIKNGVGCYSEDDVVYEGEWLDNKKHGCGKETINEVVYRGEWVNDHKEGYGIISFTKAARYDGGWKENKKNGRGTYLFPNGDRYEGEWKDDLKHGTGIYTFGAGKWEGDRYEGQWRDNKKWGRGVYKWKAGDYYDGEFEDDNFNGYGSYFFPCGDCYMGEWKSDKRNGYGIYTYHHGGKYVGNFKDGKRHGSGLFIWSDSERFEGTWDYGSRSGAGVFTKDGIEYPQIWNEPPDANYSIAPPEKYPRIQN